MFSFLLLFSSPHETSAYYQPLYVSTLTPNCLSYQLKAVHLTVIFFFQNFLSPLFPTGLSARPSFALLLPVERNYPCLFLKNSKAFFYAESIGFCFGVLH